MVSYDDYQEFLKLELSAHVTGSFEMDVFEMNASAIRSLLSGTTLW